MPNEPLPQDRDAVVADLKEVIVATLNLDGVEPGEISDEEPLFDAGLGLDSIDALELVVSVEKKYGIKIGNSEESKAALKSVDTLADLVIEKRAAAGAG